MGSRIGRNAGNDCRRDTCSGSIWPVTMIAAAASTNPSSIEPESPMKMRAGYRLCGRNPTHAPTSAARTSADRLA